MGWLRSEVRLFRALLHAYPSEFRDEYGAEMESLFRDRLRTEPRFRLWFESVADIGLNAPKEHLQILAGDLRHAVRIFQVVPGLTAVLLFVIALGIGATTAVFSLVNAVLLKSLPYGNPGKLVYVWQPNPRFKGVPLEMGPNVADFYEWQRQSHTFAQLSVYRQRMVSAVHNGRAQRLGAALVSGTFFSTLQVAPETGRTISPSDDDPGHGHVVVISDGLWRALFAGDRQVIGKPLQLGRETYHVIGVMPPDFGCPFEGDTPYGMSGYQKTEVWVPLALGAKEKNDRSSFLSVDASIGRLLPGVTPLQAQNELAPLEKRLNTLYAPEWQGWAVLVRPMRETILGPVKNMLWLLFGAVSIVLLIAMSNVVNLLLARMEGRTHELGVRKALGVQRGRLIRQLVTETLLVTLCGGLLGTLVAAAAIRGLAHLNPGNIPRFEQATIDGRVLSVSFGLSVLAGLVCAVAPALKTSRMDALVLLRTGGRGIAGQASRLRDALVVVEVALTVILLAGAGLLIRSYIQLAASNPGFMPSTLTFKVSLDDRYAKPEQRTAFFRRFLDNVRRLPGVTTAGAGSSVPLDNYESVSFADISGYGTTKEVVETRSVTPGYLEALGIPLLRGRRFEPRDVTAPVVLVTRSFAQLYFHGKDPLRERVRLGMSDFRNVPWSSVVGVIADVKQLALDAPPQPAIFGPYLPGSGSDASFSVRTRVPARQMIAVLRGVLSGMDSTLVLEDFRSMGERIVANTARRLFQTVLLLSFAASAALLALTGLYGVIAYSVKQRQSEIGLRLALGASRKQIVRTVLSEGLVLASTGLLAGLAGALALTRLIQSWLFHVSPLDPVTFTSVPVFVLAVALIACVAPSWKASRVDPAMALRSE